MVVQTDTLTFIFLMLAACAMVKAQTFPETLPVADEDDCICQRNATECNCTFVIDHRLTMIVRRNNKTELVKTENGVLKTVGGEPLTQEEASTVITADGETSRLVIAINGKFPGPRIEVHEDQILNLVVHNMFHTDSLTVHFHGLHQKGTPWMDGVAFVTQCPILPGQMFKYRLKAYPPGTSMYHAHIGDQRSMGLYGPLIIRNKKRKTRGKYEVIATLQDWNHLMDAETAYQRMITEQFENEKVVDTTYSVDGAKFSRFQFHSGLVNGKGRYWSTADSHNHAPLERFKVMSKEEVRFRVIGAMTLYPMRVYIQGQSIRLQGSDAFDLTEKPVNSIVVHPGERFDFYFEVPANSDKKELLFIAETLESAESLKNKYHAAEAVIEIIDATGTPNYDPVNTKTDACPLVGKCAVFNCPFGVYYTNMPCLSFNDVEYNEEIKIPDRILGNTVDQEYFFNFAFPGPPGNTPGSVNGRQFIPPTSSLLTQPGTLQTGCTEKDCADGNICSCTYIQNIPKDQLIQMTFLNLGSGSGWSHPVHLHGHSFYVMKMGFGTYTEEGLLVQETHDINCTNNYGNYTFCTSAEWANSSWKDGNIPNLHRQPPEKDTVVVPTGGYVVIRFISDNPGMWFLHCHIDLHNTNGMGMVINEGDGSHPKAPGGFPECGHFLYDGKTYDGSEPCTCSSTIPVAGILTLLCSGFVFIFTGIL